MNGFPSETLRNVVLIGHGASGKTSLSEALLYLTGGTKRRGNIEQGTTVSDFDSEEIRRQISINTSLIPCIWNGHKVNVLDTPGYFDFVSEVLGSLHSAEGAISVVCAASGVEVGTELTWDHAEALNLAHCVFINKMDREHANFAATLANLKERYGQAIVPVQLPIGSSESFSGVIDLVTMEAYAGDGLDCKKIPFPQHMMEEAEHARQLLIEAAASADDELTLKFLEDEPLSADEIKHGLRLAVSQRSVVPVLVGSARTGLGLPLLLDAIVAWMPSPVAMPITVMSEEGKRITLRTETPSTEMSARVFKTWADPYVGKMSLFRVYAGKISSDTTVYNVTRNKEERIGQLYFLRGKEQIPTSHIAAGDIGVVTKLHDTQTGDSLTARERSLRLPDISFPPATVTMAVRSKEKGDEEKIYAGLVRLVEEDPTVRLEKHPITGETLVSGLGELHLEVLTSRLQKKFGVQMELCIPKVAYKETLRQSAHAEYKHKKQSGGRGQYGHVVIDIEPLHNEGEFEFVDKVFGGAVPRQFIPAVEKGVRETLVEGIVAGFPVVGVRVTLLDGSAHSVDSSEMAFKLAASMAFKKAFMEASPVLLEPILTVTVVVPDEFMGDVISDLNKKRGRILGMEPHDTLQCVRAHVPQSEVFRYGIDLRSITQGRGSFTTEFAQYEEVPAELADQVIADAKNARAS